MKVIFIKVLIFFGLINFAYSQNKTYYLKSSATSFSTLSSWATNVNGSGNNPDNFEKNGDTFVITKDIVLDNNITSSSTIIFQIGNASTGVTLTIPSGLSLGSGVVNIPTASSGSNKLIISGTSIPTLGTLSTGTLGSTVEYNGSTQTITTATYNNLIISNDGTKSLSGNTIVEGKLTIQTGTAKLAVLSNTLTLNGTFSGSETNSLSLNGSSNLSIGGSGPFGTLYFDQTIPGVSKGDSPIVLTPGTTNRLNNFTVNRSPSRNFVTIGNELQITNLLTPTQGIIESDGNLVMLSTETTTSNIGDLTNSRIDGDIVVQSFFKGGTDLVNRGYRMISFPVKDDKAYPNNLFAQMKKRFVITGVGNVANNFDMGGTKQPNAVTIMTYYEPALPGVFANSYIHLPSLGTASTPGLGYFFFFRGNRDSATTTKVNDGINGYAPLRFKNPEDNTATYIGTVNEGPVNYAVTNSNPTAADDSYDGYNLVGNPFPCTIDFDLLQNDNKNDIDEIVVILKRDRTGYLTRSKKVNNVVFPTPSQSSTDIRYIQPGQGFFVKAKNNSGTLEFRESHKVTNISPIRLLNNNTKEGISLNNGGNNNNKVDFNNNNRLFIRLNVEDSLNIEPATIVLEKGFDKKYGDGDAAFFGGSTVSCNTLTEDDVPCAINFMPTDDEIDSIKIFVNSVKSNHHLKLNFTELTGLNHKQLFLLDKLENKSILINEGNTTYSFAIDKSNPLSFGNNRFLLQFKNKETLPVSYISFNAKKHLDGVLLRWETVSENGLSHYEIERSVNGEKFITIGTQKNLAVNSNSLLYSFMDKNPINGINYYRIKSVNINNPNDSQTTIIRSVDFSLSGDDELTIFPNPVVNQFTLNWKDKSYTSVLKSLSIYNLQGQLVKQINNIQSDIVNESLDELKAGNYILYVKDASNKYLASTQFIKN